MSERIYIVSIDKHQYYINTLLAIILIAAAIWFINNPPFANPTAFKKTDPVFIQVLCYIVLVAGFVMFTDALTKIRSTTPALVLTDTQIKILGCSPINWHEVESFQLSHKYRQTIIFVILKSPDEYIKKQNFLNRILLRLSSMPSPVLITCQSLLNVSVKNLMSVLNYELDRYNKIHNRDI